MKFLYEFTTLIARIMSYVAGMAVLVNIYGLLAGEKNANEMCQITFIIIVITWFIWFLVGFLKNPDD